MDIMQKIKNASLDIGQFPDVFYKIVRDIKNHDFDNSIIEKNNQTLGDIYFCKTYEVNLYGWSGLENFYNQLEQIKKLKQNKNTLINRIVLDPTLCVRTLSEQEAKQFWKKDFHQNSHLGKPFSITIIICQKIPYEANGFYSQKTKQLYLKKQLNSDGTTDLKNTIHFFSHQFVHALDHIASIVFNNNFNKIQQNFEIQENGVIYTPNDTGKSVDLHDIYNEYEQQYSSSFIEIVRRIEQDYIEDLGYYRNDFNVKEDLSNVMFCYITGFNILNNTMLDKKILKNKLQQIERNEEQQWETKSQQFKKNNKPQSYWQLFEHVLNSNSSESDIITELNEVKKSKQKYYVRIIKDMYEQIKRDSYIGQITEFERNILSSI